MAQEKTGQTGVQDIPAAGNQHLTFLALLRSRGLLAPAKTRLQGSFGQGRLRISLAVVKAKFGVHAMVAGIDIAVVLSGVDADLQSL